MAGTQQLSMCASIKEKQFSPFTLIILSAVLCLCHLFNSFLHAGRFMHLPISDYINSTVERWLGVKLEETERLCSHPNRSYKSTEIIGQSRAATPWMGHSWHAPQCFFIQQQAPAKGDGMDQIFICCPAAYPVAPGFVLPSLTIPLLCLYWFALTNFIPPLKLFSTFSIASLFLRILPVSVWC